MALRIGVIADTHGLFDPAVRRHFKGVNCILHAGDIGDPSVIRQLEDIAPVIAVSGNVDGFENSGYPARAMIRREGMRIAVRHVLFAKGKLVDDARVWLDREQLDVCVFGHSHRPTIERYGKTILFNPGSAGPKRFSLPRGLGILCLSVNQVKPLLISLPDRVQFSETVG